MFDSGIELSEVQCPNCNAETYERRCGCEGGYRGHDCGEDCCACRDPEPNVRCDACDGHGHLIWCRRCAFDLIEQRFLNGRDERTPAELKEDNTRGVVSRVAA